MAILSNVGITRLRGSSIERAVAVREAKDSVHWTLFGLSGFETTKVKVDAFSAATTASAASSIGSSSRCFTRPEMCDGVTTPGLTRTLTSPARLPRHLEVELREQLDRGLCGGNNCSFVSGLHAGIALDGE